MTALMLAAGLGHESVVVLLKERGARPVTTDPVAGLRSRAESGEPDAQYELGRLYELGQDVPHDYVQAYKWFLLAGPGGAAECAHLVLALTGLTPKEFGALHKAFCGAYALTYPEDKTADGHVRKRRSGGGRKGQLGTTEQSGG
jgi:TPR repeat protein